MSEEQTPRRHGESIADIVIRLDERTAAMARAMEELRSVIVTQPEFKPVKALAYGFAALILTGFIGTLVALVFQKGG